MYTKYKITIEISTKSDGSGRNEKYLKRNCRRPTVYHKKGVIFHR